MMTYDVSKSERYLKLVKDVRDDYINNEIVINDNLKLGWCDSSEHPNLCQEINLWTYWQGWKYCESTPHIKILLIGQDWGNPYGKQDTGVIKNVCAMNLGEDVNYLDGCDMKSNAATTDRNIAELFKTIGYHDIARNIYPDLFFSNFNLGYRQGPGSGDMKQGIIDKDGQYVMQLIDIIKPDKILCLGKMVTTATAKLLSLNFPKYKNYNEFMDNKPMLIYEGDGFSSEVYPLSHPGYFGIYNRKIEKQMEDWSRILG